MASSPDPPKSFALIDIAAVIISPALVMLMVGSLVYFLIDTLYLGAYPFRLLWCMGFFVFGAVLIARLSIETSRKYAALYAAGLGGACFLAMMTYVEFPPGILRSLGPILNILMMVLVWWMADKLTWDCTHLDEDQKTSGRGILAATGLDNTPTPDVEFDEPVETTATKKKRKKGEVEGFQGWVERFKSYRSEQKKKPHTPGTWVLYFGLGALPLFALGQALIAADDSDRRRAVFFDMAIYIGSALGLLVTTTLFGLRKYLVERNARVPPVLAMSWLGLGAGLIVVFLLVGAILPRPHSETPLVDIGRGKKGDRSASDYAQVRDRDAGKGKGAAGEKTGKGQGKKSGKGGEAGGKSGEKNSGGGKGKSEGGKQKGDSQGKQGDKSSQSNDQSKGKEQSQDKNDSSGKDQKGDEEKGDGGEEDQEGQSDSEDSGESDSGSSSLSRISSLLDGLSDIVKWIVWIVIAIAVIVGIVIFFLKYLSPFTKWAKGILDWLRGLFGPKLAGPADVTEAAVEQEVRKLPTFAEFTNPFTDGSATRRSPAELVEYSFAALDAWAWDRDRGREPGETPMEFAVRIGHEYPELDEPGYKAADAFVRVLYSTKPAPPDTPKVLEDLWDQLESTPRAARR